MAHVRERRWKGGISYTVIDYVRIPGAKRGKKKVAGTVTPEQFPDWSDRKRRELARRMASKLVELRLRRRAGLPESDRPSECWWTLDDLHRADTEDAERRGLRTSRPQFQGRLSRRESHWRKLLEHFGPATRLSEISAADLRGYVTARSKAVGPVPINRDLFGVLRPALRLARDRRDETGFSGDPFATVRKLDERTGARVPIALSERDVLRFLRACRRVRPAFGAYVELLFLTASRLNERPAVDGRFLRYPAYKRGRARAFVLEGRLSELARSKRTFSRRLWTAAAEAASLPDLRPHDLRHSRLTLEGKQPRASLDSIRKLGGWQSAAMASRYLHPDSEAIRVAWASEGHRKRSGAGRSSRLK